jgi:hypothetical protein
VRFDTDQATQMKLMIYLADIPGTVKWPSPIRYTIEDLFKRVLAGTSDFDSVKVEWSSKPPALGTYDLLVYFVGSKSDSVLVKGKLSTNPGDTGTTAIGGTTVGSEVYLSGHQDEPVGLGKLAFHELMHNICLMKDALHKVPGISLGKEEIKTETDLSEVDIKLLNQHLKKARTQWKDGYKFKPQKGDPFGDPFG